MIIEDEHLPEVEVRSHIARFLCHTIAVLFRKASSYPCRTLLRHHIDSSVPCPFTHVSKGLVKRAVRVPR